MAQSLAVADFGQVIGDDEVGLILDAEPVRHRKQLFPADTLQQLEANQFGVWGDFF